MLTNALILEISGYFCLADSLTRNKIMWFILTDNLSKYK